MKNIWIKTIYIIIFLILFLTKDNIYLLFENITFIPDNATNKYCELNSIDEYFVNELYDLEYTKVLYRDIYNFKKEITIYKGHNYGIKEDMAVIDESGLIGIITDVYDTSSKVMLLTNKDISLSVKINDDYGLLKYENNNIIISNLTTNSININSEIYTSGLANIYEGIKIGNVLKKDTTTSKDNYIVNEYGDLYDINFLAVIKDVK